MWNTAKLGDVIEKGETINPTTNPDIQFNYIDVSSVDRASFRIGKTQSLLGKDAPSRARRAVRTGDVLFATIRPTLQRVAIVPEELNGEVCSTGYIVLRPKSGILCSKFIFYYMLSEKVKAEMEGLQTGASYPAVNDTQVKNLHISYPPLAEQQRIVAKLDAAFTEIDVAIEVLENNKNQGRKLFQRVLSDLISKKSENDSSLTLKEIAKFLDYRGKTPPKAESGIKLLTAKNVRMGFIRNQPEEFVSEEGYRQHMTRGFPKEGDVIFTTEAPLGLVAQIEDDSFALGQRLITFQILNDVMKSTYLKFVLMSEPYQKIILEKGTGATVKGIKASLLKEIKIAFPVSLDEQENRIAVIEEVEKNCNDLANNYTKQVSLYQSLKSTILAQELQSEAA